MISISPSTLLPLYIFNYEICYDRNVLFGVNTSAPIQIALTVLSLSFLLYVVLTQSAARYEKLKIDKIHNIYLEAKMILRIFGTVVLLLVTALSMIALLAVNKQEY